MITTIMLGKILDFHFRGKEMLTALYENEEYLSEVDGFSSILVF